MVKYAPPVPGYAAGSLIKRISKLPRWERRLYFWNKVKPRYPRYIYKYRDLTRESDQSIERLKNILVGSFLWLSSPRDFNDPFDMSANIIMSGTTQERVTKFKHLIKNYSKGISLRAREQKLRELMSQPEHEVIRNVRLAYENNIQSTGVCSFSEDPRNILMWSHYARNHQGIALQFEIAKDPNTFLKAVSVEYNDEYPTVNWLNETSQEVSKILLRKHAGWAYERERRIIYPGGANTLLPFLAESLTGIVLGCRMQEETKELIHELVRVRTELGYPETIIYLAHKHPHRFELQIGRGKS